MIFREDKGTGYMYCYAPWHSRNFDIPKEELSSLVWELPTTKIASMYGVSDVAKDLAKDVKDSLKD